MSERTRSRLRAKMHFLCRLAGLSPTDRMRGSAEVVLLILGTPCYPPEGVGRSGRRTGQADDDDDDDEHEYIITCQNNVTANQLAELDNAGYL